MSFSPYTATPLNALAELLLRSDVGLTKGERELIATYVSYLNECFFCQRIHGAVAQYYFNNVDEDLVRKVKENYKSAPISDKLKFLLAIAENVQKGGKYVKIEQVEEAKKFGTTDLEIHDTVLIAAAFCMFNRYVDGMGTFAPENPELYKQRAKRIAEETGYVNSI